jgi:hypothetical protein
MIFLPFQSGYRVNIRTGCPLLNFIRQGKWKKKSVYTFVSLLKQDFQRSGILGSGKALEK